MNKILTHIDTVLAYFLMALMALMVVDVTWQVVTRFILGSPSPFTEELARFLLIWIGILGAAYAFRKKAHLGLDLLTNKMAPRVRYRTQILTNFLCAGFAANVMIYGGLNLVLLTLDLGQISAALRINMGYVYSVLPISGTLFCIYALDNMWQAWRGLKNCAHADPAPQHSIQE